MSRSDEFGVSDVEKGREVVSVELLGFEEVRSRRVRMA